MQYAHLRGRARARARARACVCVCVKSGEIMAERAVQGTKIKYGYTLNNGNDIGHENRHGNVNEDMIRSTMRASGHASGVCTKC